MYMSEDAAFAFSGFYSAIPNLQIANIGVVLVAFNVVVTKPVSGMQVTGTHRRRLVGEKHGFPCASAAPECRFPLAAVFPGRKLRPTRPLASQHRCCRRHRASPTLFRCRPAKPTSSPAEAAGCRSSPARTRSCSTTTRYSTPGCNMPTGATYVHQVDSDGNNYRLANTTGCPTGAVIIGEGTTGTNGIGSTATSVTIAVSAGRLGSGRPSSAARYRPRLLPAPPARAISIRQSSLSTPRLPADCRHRPAVPCPQGQWLRPTSPSTIGAPGYSSVPNLTFVNAIRVIPRGFWRCVDRDPDWHWVD